MTELKTPCVDVMRAARLSQCLSGTAALATLERLRDSVHAVATDAVVRWQARFSQREAPDGGTQDWLHLQASSSVVLVCQRCLSDVTIALDVARDFRFVATEAQAQAEDDDAEEDLLVRSKQFDLLALVEDELILALPLVALHTLCPADAPVPTVSQVSDEADVPAPHPFAALRDWPKSR